MHFRKGTWGKKLWTHTISSTWIKPESLDWEVEDPNTGNIIKRTNIRRKIDIDRKGCPCEKS